MARITSRLTAIDPPGVGGSNVLVRVLVTVEREPGVSSSAIADRLELDRTAASRALRNLDALGLITRRADPKDRRYVKVRLSRRGQEAMAAFHADVARTLAGVVVPIEQVSTALHRPFPEVTLEVGGISQAEAVDRATAVGGRARDGFESAEAHVALKAQERYVLWAVIDTPGVSSDRIAAEIDVAVSDVRSAARSLKRRGYLTVDADGGFEPTPEGEKVAALHRDVLLANESDLLRALALMRAVVAGGTAS